jgi:hypothetical protein
MPFALQKIILKMENVEYTFLRTKEQLLQRFLIEKPFGVTIICLMLLSFGSNGWSSFLPTLGIGVLIIYFNKTILQLEKVERIKTYIKFVLEKDVKYIGWENFIESYNSTEVDTMEKDEIENEDFIDLHYQYQRLKSSYILNIIVLVVVSILRFISVQVQKSYLSDIVNNMIDNQASFITIFPLLAMIASILIMFRAFLIIPAEGGLFKLTPIYNCRKKTKIVIDKIIQHNEKYEGNDSRN